MKCKEMGVLVGSSQVKRFAALKTVVMHDGERYSTLVDNSGIPLFYPTLYVTTKLRNRSLSHSTLVNESAAINVLLQLFHERGIDIHKRIESGSLLQEHEIDAVRDRCQQKMLAKPERRGQQSYSYFASENYVTAEAEYARLTTIHRYLKFLCERILPNRHLPEVVAEVEAMLDAIATRRPIKKGRNSASVQIRTTEIDIKCLFEVFRPESEFNPWDDYPVKVRNRVAFLLLYELGIRRGELLNLRCDDFDFSHNRLSIVRRPDELIDSRDSQPLVKTNERVLSVNDRLAKKVGDYITKIRNETPNARTHPYLLVSHSGPTTGMPLTISGYKKIMDVVRVAAPSLQSFTGHKLRHHWNERFSEKMDTMDNPPDEAVQEKMRSYAMGWKSGSGSSAVYNKRFIERKTHEAGMALQDGKVRLPKELLV